MSYTTKITRNNLKAVSRVYRAPFGSLQHLFKDSQCSGYNAGLYGWNYNVFQNPAGNAAIVTGYRCSFKYIEIPADLCSRYDDTARKAGKLALTYSEYYQILEQIQAEFFRELSKL